MFQRNYGAREGSIQCIGQSLGPALPLQGRQQQWWRVIIICANADIGAVGILIELIWQWF
jgi:hypothetical protein